MRNKILKEFKSKEQLTSRDLTRKFGVSRQAIHWHLQALLREGSLLKLGTSRKTSYYVLNRPSALKKVWKGQKTFKKRYRAQNLDEESAYREIEGGTPLLRGLSPEALRIFHYAFTEMVNNAIDHSRSPFVDVSVSSSPDMISFTVTDAGVGVFENIRSKKGLGNEMEALQDLLKGKQTTAPEAHSGEGIFFTSKAADRFALESHRKKLLVDNTLPDIFVEDIRHRKGTAIRFSLNPRTKKRLEKLFQEFTNEDFQFQKSHVAIKLFQTGEEYVSRSQAKRLLHSLDRFTEVVLDFKDVPTVGQGFADEIFRVFASRHPEIRLEPIRCHENVRFMIDRAKAGLEGMKKAKPTPAAGSPRT